eukprot:10448177-Alexandrium_andersonii.AAC.1
MSASLVGSEMCIRDRVCATRCSSPGRECLRTPTQLVAVVKNLDEENRTPTSEHSCSGVIMLVALESAAQARMRAA